MIPVEDAEAQVTIIITITSISTKLKAIQGRQTWIFDLHFLDLGPAMIPVEDAEAHVSASVRGTQPELTGITKSLEMAILKIDAKNIFLSPSGDLGIGLV